VRSAGPIPRAGAQAGRPERGQARRHRVGGRIGHRRGAGRPGRGDAAEAGDKQHPQRIHVRGRGGRPAAEALGGHAWEKAGQIWYDTICDKKLAATADFAHFAGGTAFNAGHRYGTASHEQKAVIAAWKEVGVTPPQ